MSNVERDSMRLSLLARTKIFFAAIAVLSPLHAKVVTQNDLAVIVRDLTRDPIRQQKALDRLAKSEGQLLEYLPIYFSDKRKIADTNVRFLNTHPKAIEKYFLTYATTVDEVIIQYFCFRTERCIPTVDPVKLKKIRKQFSRRKC